MKAWLALSVSAMLVAGCALRIDETSLIPDLEAPSADLRLETPQGYTQSQALFPIHDLGVVHTVRLDRPDTDDVVLFAGGSGFFTAKASRRLARLAEVTKADIITFDYPGRSGTTLAPTTETLIAMGPALVAQLRSAGWINSGKLYAYGLSFGGASASNLAQTGGFSGLILESSSSDITAIGRNLVPAAARPFVRLEVDPELLAFDYFGYALKAKAPILLLAARDDALADVATITTFADQLRQAGATVSVIQTPGRHGEALYAEEASRAIKDLMAQTP